MLHGKRKRGGSVEGSLTGEDLKENHAQCVKITASVCIVPERLFGAHVTGRANDAGLSDAGGGLRKFGNTKIGDEGVAYLIEEEVARFEIAMNDTLAVCEIECISKTKEDVGNLIEGDAALADAFGERAAGHVAHDVEQLIVFVTDIIHRDDGGMFEFGHDLGLALEAFAQFGLVKQFMLEDLNRNIPLEHRIIGAIDCSHPPDAQPFNDLVAVEFLFWCVHLHSSTKPSITSECPGSDTFGLQKIGQLHLFFPALGN